MLRWPVLFLILLFAWKPADAQYVVTSGDTLSGIANKTLGDGKRWREIADLNRIPEPYRLQVGQQLRIPAATITGNRIAQATTASALPQSQPNRFPQHSPNETSISDDEDGLVHLLSSWLGADSRIPVWLAAWPLLIPLLIGAFFLVAYIVFWATGIMFTMYLFKHELSRRRAIFTASACFGISIVMGLPLCLLELNEENITRYLPWIGGLTLIYMILCIGTTRRIIQCPWWQSPIIFFFSQVFGMATAMSLIYAGLLVVMAIVAFFF